MTRIGKPTPSAPRSEPRRTSAGEAPPSQHAGSARPAQPSQASSFDRRRTYSRLTGVTSKRPGASHASLRRVDDDERDVGDPSLGRNCGTPDDSTGRNRGTPDDSIGRGGSSSSRRKSSSLFDQFAALLPAGRRGDDARAQLEFLLRGGQTRAMRENGTTREDAIAGLFGFGLSSRNSGSARRTSAGPTGGGMEQLLNQLLVQSGKKKQRGTASSSPGASNAGTAAQGVLDSREFGALSLEEQRAVQGLLAKGGAHAATGLAELFRTGQTALLRERDANGTSVLEHLEALAASPFPNLVGDVLSDIATPKDIEQGYAPTCTAASMQYELAKKAPAEYARLLAGLATDGEVKMAGGGLLRVDVAHVIQQSNASNDQRTDSEAVFQTAAMDFANGDDVFNVDRQRSEGGDRVYRGLFPDQVRALVSQLFNESYVTEEVTSDAEAADQWTSLAARRPEPPRLLRPRHGQLQPPRVLRAHDGHARVLPRPVDGHGAQPVEGRLHSQPGGGALRGVA